MNTLCKYFSVISFVITAMALLTFAHITMGCTFEEPTDADLMDGDIEVEQDGAIYDLCEEGESVCRCHNDFPTISFVARCDRGGFRVAYACGEREACVNLSLDPPRVDCVPLLPEEAHPCE